MIPWLLKSFQIRALYFKLQCAENRKIGRVKRWVRGVTTGLLYKSCIFTSTVPLFDYSYIQLDSAQPLWPGGIDSLELIPGLLNSFKIRGYRVECVLVSMEEGNDGEAKIKN